MDTQNIKQLDLFDVKDDRITKLRTMFRSEMHFLNRKVFCWQPNVREIEHMERDWKINGCKILDIYQEEKDKYILNNTK